LGFAEKKIQPYLTLFALFQKMQNIGDNVTKSFFWCCNNRNTTLPALVFLENSQK